MTDQRMPSGKIAEESGSSKGPKKGKNARKGEAPHRRLSGSRTKIKVTSNKMLKGTYKYILTYKVEGRGRK